MRNMWIKMRQCAVGVFMAIGMVAPVTVAAQDTIVAPPTSVRTLTASEAVAVRNSNRTTPTESKAVTYLTDRELYQTVAFLIFGLFVLAIEYLLLRRVAAEADQILRVFSMTLILVGTLIAISAGFRIEQTAAAIGLFGTIAGYVLGRRDAKG